MDRSTSKSPASSQATVRCLLSAISIILTITASTKATQCGPGVPTVCPGFGSLAGQQCCGGNNTCGYGYAFCGEGCQTGWGPCRQWQPDHGFRISESSGNVNIVSIQQSPSDTTLWVAGHFYGAVAYLYCSSSNTSIELRHKQDPGVPSSVTLECPDQQWNGFMIKFQPKTSFPFDYTAVGYSVFGACFHGTGLLWTGADITTFDRLADTKVVDMKFQRQTTVGYAGTLSDTFKPVLLIRFNNSINVAQNVTFITVNLTNTNTETNWALSWFRFNSGSPALNYRLSWWPSFTDIGYCNPSKCEVETGWDPHPLPSQADSLGMIIAPDFIYYWGTWTSTTFSLSGSNAEDRGAGRGIMDTWLLRTQVTNPRPGDPSPSAAAQYFYGLGGSTTYAKGRVTLRYTSTTDTLPAMCFDYTSMSIQIGGISTNAFSKLNGAASTSELACIMLTSALLWDQSGGAWRYAVNSQSLVLTQAEFPPKQYTDVVSSRHIAVAYTQTPSSAGFLAQGFCLVHYNSSNTFTPGCALNGPYLIPNAQQVVFSAVPSVLSAQDRPYYNWYMAGSIRGTFSGSADAPTFVTYPPIGPADVFITSLVDFGINTTHLRAYTFQKLGSDAGASGPSFSISGFDLNVTGSKNDDIIRIYGEYTASTFWKPVPTESWSSNLAFPAATSGTFSASAFMLSYSYRLTMEIDMAPAIPAPVGPPANPPVLPPAPTPIQCPNPPPTSVFRCNATSGNWFANGLVLNHNNASSPIPIIGRAVVSGNATLTGAVISFTSTASLQVEGCVIIDQLSIQLAVTPSQVRQAPRLDLIISDSGCLNATINQVTVENLDPLSRSCATFTTAPQINTRTLTVLVQVNDDRCNSVTAPLSAGVVWWHILVGCIAGIVALAILAVVITLIVPSLRKRFFPSLSREKQEKAELAQQLYVPGR